MPTLIVISSTVLNCNTLLSLINYLLNTSIWVRDESAGPLRRLCHCGHLNWLTLVLGR